MARLLRFLLLIAVMMMPFGMATATAAPERQTAAGMPMRHCPQQDKTGFVQCAMACSAALPASEIWRAEPAAAPCAPAEAELVHQLHGLHGETATPPPKLP